MHRMHAALPQAFGVAERIGTDRDAGHACSLASEGFTQNFFSERVLLLASTRCVPLLQISVNCSS